MFRKTLAVGAIALAGFGVPAAASTLLSGVFEIGIHNFMDGGTDGDVTKVRSNATVANVGTVARDATVTWTGTLNFSVPSGNSGTTTISDFFTSVFGNGSLTDVDATELAFLNTALLSRGSYKTTTFFDITGIFAGAITNGLITHDDGVTLIANGLTGGVSTPPTTQAFTPFTANAGNFRLIYAAANGNPSILRVTGDVAPVPLPAGVVLLLSGLGGLALARRRKNRAA